MNGLLPFLRDRRGVAAVELALIAPIMGVMALLSFEVWQAAGRSADMRTALKAGTEYYMNGGSNDVAAEAMATAAWRGRPASGDVIVGRVCACGTTPHSCSTLCADSQPPAALVTISATATYPDAMFSPYLSVSRAIRVR